MLDPLKGISFLSHLGFLRKTLAAATFVVLTSFLSPIKTHLTLVLTIHPQLTDKPTLISHSEISLHSHENPTKPSSNLHSTVNPSVTTPSAFFHPSSTQLPPESLSPQQTLHLTIGSPLSLNPQPKTATVNRSLRSTLHRRTFNHQQLRLRSTLQPSPKTLNPFLTGETPLQPQIHRPQSRRRSPSSPSLPSTTISDHNHRSILRAFVPILVTFTNRRLLKTTNPKILSSTTTFKSQPYRSSALK